MRKTIVHTLDSLGLKRPLKEGVNRLLEAGGLPPIGEPRVFRELERLAAGPRPRPESVEGRLLLFTMRGWSTHVALESLLAEAAAQRGLQPHVFTCGGPLPLCGITTFRAEDPTPCGDCHGYASRWLDTLGFEATRLGDLVSDEERDDAAVLVAKLDAAELPAFVHEGMALGRMIQTSVRWFLLRGSAGTGPVWVDTERSFLTAALVMRTALDRLLDRVRPDRVLCLSGLFFAERILFDLARRRGIPITTYERGFMPNTWVFRHDDIAPAYGIADDFVRIAAPRPSPEEARRVDAYLTARMRGGADTDKYWPAMEHDKRAVASALGLDLARPVVAAFTNITWDSAIQDRDVAFDGMFDWLERTVRHFASSDAQLVLRIHPAEVRLVGQETTEAVIDTLRSRLGGDLPAAVRIVPPESPLSSYALAALSGLALVYTSTLGLELACAGRPVVVAGDTHYRGLGFTIDVDDAAGYGALLDRLLTNAPRPDVERARAYAHFFFFRFMVPLPFLEEGAGRRLHLRLTSLAELGPGHDAGLDRVLDGLLHGTPIFVDPDPGQPPPCRG